MPCSNPRLTRIPSSGACDGIGGPGEDVGSRLLPGVLEGTGLDAAPPDVGVHRVGRLLGDRDLDAVLAGEFDLLRTAHLPVADRGHHLKLGSQGCGGDVEAHLVVALAGAAVGDRRGALVAGHVDQDLGDQRSGQGGGQRVGALVHRRGGQAGEAELLDEEAARVDRVGGQRAGAQGAVGDRLDVLRLADVGGAGDHLVAEPLLQPADRDRGVETAGIGEDAALGFAHRNPPRPLMDLLTGLLRDRSSGWHRGRGLPQALRRRPRGAVRPAGVRRVASGPPPGRCRRPRRCRRPPRSERSR